MKAAPWHRSAAWILAPFAVVALIQRWFIGSADPPPAAVAGLAQALPVVDHWGEYGGILCAQLIAAIGVACIPYACALRCAAAAPLTARAVAAVAAIGCGGIALAWCWSVVYSSDLYAYAAYGDLALHGVDPYAHRVLIHRDAIVDAAIFQWGNPPPRAVYGPLFVTVAAGAVWIAHGDAGATLWALRGFELAAFAGALVAFAAALRAWKHPAPLLALCTLGLNPLVIWTVAEGHNDVAAFALAAATFAVARRAPLGAGIVAAAATAIKATGSIAVLAALPMLARERGRSWQRFAAGAAAGVALMAAGYAAFLHDPAASNGPARVAAGQLPGGTIPWLVSLAFPQAAGIERTALVVACSALIALAFLALGIRAARRSDRSWLGIAALGVLYASPQLYAWYAIWTIGAAALLLDAAGITALVTSVLTVLQYLHDAVDDGALWLAIPVITMVIVPPVLFIALAREDRAARR